MSTSIRKLLLCSLLAVGFVGNLQCYAADETTSMDLLAEFISKETDSSVQKSLLKGILAGLRGRRNVEPPSSWNELSANLAASGDAEVRSLTQQLA